jgi:hypothetical protein
MTGRNPRPEKLRDYRRASHGTAGTQCMGHLPPTYGIGDNGYPRLHHTRCLRRIGVTVWQGHHGQILAACPLHRADVEAQDAPYRPDPDFANRMRHEMEETTREELSR